MQHRLLRRQDRVPVGSYFTFWKAPCPKQTLGRFEISVVPLEHGNKRSAMDHAHFGDEIEKGKSRRPDRGAGLRQWWMGFDDDGVEVGGRVLGGSVLEVQAGDASAGEGEVGRGAEGRVAHGGCIDNMVGHAAHNFIDSGYCI